MLGPFVQGFCDWVLDVCASAGRTEIHPLMREAHLLAPALEQAARMRGLNVAVKPLYVSRQATMLAAMERFGEHERDKVLALGHITAGEVLTMLGVGPKEMLSLPPELAGRLNDAVADWDAEDGRSGSAVGGANLLDAFKSFLLREPVRVRAEQTIAEQRRLLLRHILETCEAPDKLVTVDLGFNGTIQAALDAAYALEGVPGQSIHLLAAGTEAAVERLFQGTDIRRWLGTGGEEGDLAKRFVRSPGLIEELLMGEFGSTVRYEAGPDGRVSPVMAELSLPPEQFAFKRACREGVFVFQRAMAHWRTRKPALAYAAAGAGAAAWAKPMHRVLDMPTPEEARRLGGLVHQDNFGGVQVVTLADPPLIPWREKGVDYLIDLGSFGPKTANLFWPQGIATASEPYRLYESFLRLTDSFGSAVTAFRTIDRLKREPYERAYLLGEGGGFADRLAAEALLHRVRLDARIRIDLSPNAKKPPAELQEAVASDRGGHVYVIGTLTDIEEYKTYLTEAYAQARPGLAPRIVEPLA
ncbi:hypothetical protein DLM86_01985 [Paenibacillus flagellatus]|uniref:Uncharacterized protein n=2 Tax=Paenibacillus flagellatus TaxID=2211139 RepID=A0A2V5L366_9BACL|nr:hypothetical protein DLM86_01985 [Paenibacillus flagellatus]